MISKGFPATPEPIILMWRIGNGGYMGIADLGEYIKVYFWDGIGMSWNKVDIYEKVTNEQIQRDLELMYGGVNAK